ncbi:hypothetical protein ABIE44_001134 [Marmoricola sp. OAE513]|uniref:hypothetical protein n=1 Tax=Marmoricola sp. OAE513 TaxID=2817894 RepID=UPI001AE35940
MTRSLRDRFGRGPGRRYREVGTALDRIASAAALPGDDRAAAKRRRKQAAAELGPVRAHLRAAPEDEGKVRADISARGLDELFPWRRLNEGRARDLAVLYCFTPYQDTSALVAARRIHTRGVVTDVISQQLDDTRQTDLSSRRIAREFLDQTRILEGPSDHGSWEHVRTFVEGVLAEVSALEAEKGPYRTLYTRAMAAHSHFAGAVLKLRNPDLHWTAEFSDPLHLNAYGEVRANDVADDWLVAEISAGIEAAGFSVPATRRLFTWAELVAYALADDVLFTNSHQQQFMLGYCEDRALADRAATIARSEHQPTLPPSFYRLGRVDYDLDPGVVNIGYFGHFFRTRGLTEVVEAISRLDPQERSRVRLHVFTGSPAAVVQEVADRGLGDVVSVRGYAGFLPFLTLTTLFDVLLVNDAVTTDVFDINPYLPSKVSDYLGSGTPIWGVYEPGSILSGLEIAHRSELGDAHGALAVLRRLIGPSAVSD